VKDKRRFNRFAVDVFEINGAILFTNKVEILDITIGGVSLKTDRRLHTGNEYTLTLWDKNKVIALKGTVVWSSATDVGPGTDREASLKHTAGLNFARMTSEKKTKLINFINAYRHDLTQPFDLYDLSGLRLHIRVKIQTPLRASLNYPESYKVKKISLRGALVEGRQAIDVEARLPMEITLPEDSVITFTGRIVSCIMIDEYPNFYDIGIEFIDISDSDHKRLKEFLSVLPETC
jgi:hypothetical protein